jgi:hypothetical protein
MFPTDAAALTEMVLALDAENEKLRVAMQTLKSHGLQDIDSNERRLARRRPDSLRDVGETGNLTENRS